MLKMIGPLPILDNIFLEGLFDSCPSFTETNLPAFVLVPQRTVCVLKSSNALGDGCTENIIHFERNCICLMI